VHQPLAGRMVFDRDWIPWMCTGWCVNCCGGRNPSRRPVERTFFYRLAKFAMRRAIPVRLVGAALLIALGLPFSQAKWGLPDDRAPVEYLAAMIAILASGAPAAEQVCAALMFTIVAFTVAEVPLVSYLFAPTKTLAVVHRLNDWMTGRRNAITAVVVAAHGALLVVTGLGKM
jgi:Sap, sulfolipid-1-addressing protein